VAEAWWFHHFDTYALSNAALESLTTLIDLKSAGIQVAIVDMPIHPSFLLYFDRGTQYQQLYLDTVSARTKDAGVPFWQVPPSMHLPDDQWLDRMHLDPRGAVTFSAWLGERTAQAIAAGELILTTP
jgi:hypothetical protein